MSKKVEIKHDCYEVGYNNGYDDGKEGLNHDDDELHFNYAGQCRRKNCLIIYEGYKNGWCDGRILSEEYKSRRSQCLKS